MKRAFLLFLLSSLTLLGQATRTWVSGVGDDVNPCSRTAPCKTFAGAISKTAAGGEISVLDPGGYGAVTITKSITIDGAGTQASILSSGTTGVIINAGANDVVVLRNLSINGAGTGTHGIRLLQAASLSVESCNLQNFTTDGILVSTSTSANLSVRNTTISKAVTGIRLNATAGVFAAAISRASIANNTNGVHVSYGNADVYHSTLQNSTGSALLADSTGKLFAANNLIANNGAGLRANGSSTILISNNDVVDNGTGFACAGTGAIKTAGNNRKVDNLGGASECAPSGAITVQ